ncbi:MAG: GNAT family N-acetyltransferase [Candidatus Micrarchaeota archaeon]|nr:GNAT family N-acetyltransferase [Candidatus Micrarchaeota archaeon]
MNYPADYCLMMQRPVLTETIEINGKKIEVLFEIAKLAYVSFQTAILASAIIDGQKELVGWVGFHISIPGRLWTVPLDLMELRETKVDPSFFGHGLGSRLVQIAQIFAREQGKLLYLKPERPGEGIAKEARDVKFPLSTEQLDIFYRKHGFREMTLSERFGFSRDILSHELTTELLMHGLDPTTLEFGEIKSRVNLKNELTIAINLLPIAVRLKLLLTHFEKEKAARYKNDYMYDPGNLVKSKVKEAIKQTKGILLAREDLELPRFKPSYKILHPPKPHPPIAARVRI